MWSALAPTQVSSSGRTRGEPTIDHVLLDGFQRLPRNRRVVLRSERQPLTVGQAVVTDVAGRRFGTGHREVREHASMLAEPVGLRWGCGGAFRARLWRTHALV
jgi:hypothetical protein